MTAIPAPPPRRHTAVTVALLAVFALTGAVASVVAGAMGGPLAAVPAFVTLTTARLIQRTSR